MFARYIISQRSNIKTYLSPDKFFLNHAHAMSWGKQSIMKTREYDSTNMALEHSTKLIHDGNHVESQLTRSKTGPAGTGKLRWYLKRKITAPWIVLNRASSQYILLKFGYNELNLFIHVTWNNPCAYSLRCLERLFLKLCDWMMTSSAIAIPCNPHTSILEA